MVGRYLTPRLFRVKAWRSRMAESEGPYDLNIPVSCGSSTTLLAVAGETLTAQATPRTLLILPWSVIWREIAAGLSEAVIQYSNCMFFPFNQTSRCGPLRGPSSSSCGGLWPSAEAFFALWAKKRSFYVCFGPNFGHFW